MPPWMPPLATAYGWPADLTDSEILSRLLERNRAARLPRE